MLRLIDDYVPISSIPLYFQFVRVIPLLQLAFVYGLS